MKGKKVLIMMLMLLVASAAVFSQGEQEASDSAQSTESHAVVSAKAVDLDHMDNDDTRKAELVLAIHVLVDQEVLDSFGHLSVRSVSDPNVFYIPRAMTPALVQVEDLVAVSVETGQPVNPDSPRCNGERYIHSELYKARPEVNSVLHSHTASVIPFTVAGVPLRPVLAQADFLPLETPVFEIRDAWGPDAEERGVQIRNTEHAAAAAKAMGNSPVILLRGHGMNVASDSIHRIVVQSIYTMINAKVEREAITLADGEITALDQKELDYYTKENFDVERPWSNFLRIMQEHEAVKK